MRSARYDEQCDSVAKIKDKFAYIKVKGEKMYVLSITKYLEPDSQFGFEVVNEKVIKDKYFPLLSEVADDLNYDVQM